MTTVVKLATAPGSQVEKTKKIGNSVTLHTYQVGSVVLNNNVKSELEGRGLLPHPLIKMNSDKSAASVYAMSIKPVATKGYHVAYARFPTAVVDKMNRPNVVDSLMGIQPNDNAMTQAPENYDVVELRHTNGGSAFGVVVFAKDTAVQPAPVVQTSSAFVDTFVGQ